MPVHGGNLVFANPQDAQSLNESNVFDNNSIWIIEQITQPLFTVTSNGKGVMPWLATGYTVSKNQSAYTITLRPGVKFSNATPTTSEDVQFTLEQTMAASQGWGYIDSAIKSVTAPSADTVVVNLKYKWVPILADLALFANGIVPANYGGKTEILRLSTTRRSARARSASMTGTRAARSSSSRTPTTGSPASRTWTA